MIPLSSALSRLSGLMVQKGKGSPLELPYLILYYKGKGKAIPLQAWTGPEGSRRLRLPDFMTIST
jgi:hypothetical protein